MSDVVERLRRRFSGGILEIEAADEIERLRAALAAAEDRPCERHVTQQRALLEEIERLERLRTFDTGSASLPKGVALEHARIDAMWQQLVRERDAAVRDLAEARATARWLLDSCTNSCDNGCDCETCRHAATIAGWGDDDGN
jgi:hypothetical protein